MMSKLCHYENTEKGIKRGINNNSTHAKPLTSKISIIIPIYNKEKYLDKCLNTVRGQSLLSIEIVCINDGSIDNSLAILYKHANEDSRIKIISHENRGVGKARNEGI